MILFKFLYLPQITTLNIRLADDHVWKIAIHLAVAGGVNDGVFLCCPFYQEMSWLVGWLVWV